MKHMRTVSVSREEWCKAVCIKADYKRCYQQDDTVKAVQPL